MTLSFPGIQFTDDPSSLSLYGDGHDGDVTITVSTTTTLTHDMYYRDLTVDGTLDCNGYKVFVQRCLYVSATGIIDNPGGNG